MSRAREPIRVLPVLMRGVLSVVVVLVALVVFMGLVRGRPEAERKPPQVRELFVRSTPVRSVSIPRRWSGYGTARPMRAAEVSAEVAARVVERPGRIEAGAPVTGGELLMRLDDTDYAAQLASARDQAEAERAIVAQLDVSESALTRRVGLARSERELAHKEYRRTMDAFESGAAQEREVEAQLATVQRLDREVETLAEQLAQVPPRRAETKARHAALLAQQRLAEEQLARTRIVAPFAGVLQRVEADVGERLAVGEPVARIVDLSRVEVPLRLAVSAGGSVRVGDSAELGTDAGRTWAGRVGRIAPEADELGRTITVFVEVEQDPASPEDLLRPGEFVWGTIVASSPEPTLIVPRRAVLDDVVMVAEAFESGFVARPHQVAVAYHMRGPMAGADPRETEWSALSGGPPEGALIIVSNLDVLSPGMRVRVDAAGDSQGSTP